MSADPRVSVAVSLFNEEDVFPELLRRLRAVLDAIPGGPHEIVFVDDGSSDRTFEQVTAASEDPRVVGVALSRNFGHQAALSAALDFVTGDVVVVMDGDLQDAPEAIPLLMAEQKKGYDVVYALRKDRKEAWPLRLCYYVFYRLVALLSDVRLPLDAGDFAVLSRRVVDRIKSLPERHRYLRGLRTWVGFRQTGLPVERSKRYSGRSKYGFFRLLRLALDGILAFSMVPLRAAALLGVFAIGGSLAYTIYAVLAKFFSDRSPQGFTALIFAITFLAGVQLLFLGVIGEYLGRVYEEAKGRPHYIVSATVGGERNTSS